MKLVVLKYIILIASQLKWALDILLHQSFFQPRGIELLDYVDDLTVMRYENNNNAASEDSSVECAVCLCRIDEGDEVRELRCNHLYHRVCLDRWLGYGHRTCPLCRNNLKPPRLVADLHHAEAEVILINFCTTRSRDDRCTWWLR
ncbi:brassinosteroid-responsive RING-H2 [Abeliophyllum distichum]|uniref:Brassinosteroid-responsive RING-H2 n=1 Tax=Abeliophyllum distichum TaxID=126358 RepID=A0ABD1W1E8_9LAMI